VLSELEALPLLSYMAVALKLTLEPEEEGVPKLAYQVLIYPCLHWTSILRHLKKTTVIDTRIVL
jgi:hypothetical protein